MPFKETPSQRGTHVAFLLCYGVSGVDGEYKLGSQTGSQLIENAAQAPLPAVIPTQPCGSERLAVEGTSQP